MAQNMVKQQPHQHDNKMEFELDDWVFLRLQPYKQMSLKKQKKGNKLTQNIISPIRFCKGLEVLLTN
jgi:hypothetical protein